MKRRILSMILVLTMIVTLMPVSALSEVAVGEFASAAVTPNGEYYTPGSKIQFAATGADAAGNKVDLPDGLVWALEDETAGTISESGLFTAAEDFTGEVNVLLKQGSKTVGSTTVYVQIPDSIEFANSGLNLKYNEEKDLSLVARYNGNEVNYKVGDIIWDVSVETISIGKNGETEDVAAGYMDGNTFVANPNNSLGNRSVESTVTATLKWNANVTDTMTVGLCMAPVVVLDGGDNDGLNYENIPYVYAAASGGGLVYEYPYTDDGVDGNVILVHYNGRGGQSSAEQVDANTGEVRFGQKALKVNYDFTNITGTEGACIGIDHDITIPGNPTGIGVWVYAPEGTPNLWIRIRVKDGTGTIQTLNFTSQCKQACDPADAEYDGTMGGINWSGWKYLECQFDNSEAGTQLVGPFTLMAGETVRVMALPATGNEMGTWVCQKDAQGNIPEAQYIGWENCKGCFYVDNLQFVYGSQEICHSYTAVVTDPTCTEQGYTTHTCILCGDSYVDNYTDPVGHNYVDGVCTICGDKEVTIVASGTCGDDLTWTLDSEGTLTISGTGEMYDYHCYAPDQAPWYANKSDIKSVVIYPGATSIGEYAFNECSSLTSVTIPDSVTSIGYNAFEDCTGLTSVTISANVTEIGGGAFAHCCSLTSINVSEDNEYYTSVDGVLFNKNKTELLQYPAEKTEAEYVIPDSVKYIEEAAFYDCDNLTSITIPDSVTDIGFEAFECCSGLTNVIIPDSVTFIDSYAFCVCESLTSVTISDSLTNIGEGLFENCTSLTNIIIPDSVIGIGFWAFAECSSLTNVTIPNSVTDIGEAAFAECSSLADVYYCGTEEQWNAITIDEDNDYLTDATRHYHNYVDGVCTICGDKEVTIVASGTCGDNLTWTLDSEGILTISGTGEMTEAPWIDDYSEQIKTVVVEDGVTSIIESAFHDCTNLTSATIGSGVTNVGVLAFFACSGLTSIEVSENNENYTSIDGVLFNKDKTELIQYPAGKTEAEYVIPDSVTSISVGAFYGCSNLTSIIIPDSVTSIENATFYGCSNLMNVTIPDSVTYIGVYAFNECSSLESIIIPDSVTDIDDYAFYNCSGLTSVIIPDSVTSIGDGMFCECSSLESITIPDSVTSIGDYAFACCDSLESVTIPDSVTSIGEYAFQKCYSLESITIPDGVTSIGYGAFSGSSLARISIPESVTNIENDAFRNCSSLADVYYCGTEDQWNSITIGTNNDYLTNATRHYHDYVDVVAAPTCTEQGYTTHTCSICGDTYVDDYVAPLDHNYTAKVTAPTCTEQGYTTYTCACGDSYVDNYVAPLGHDYVNGFCSKCGAEDPDYDDVIREGFIVVSDERARAGEEVTVSVSIEENPGIMVMILDLDYDESKLEFLGYEDGLMKGWRVSEKAVWIGGDNMTEDGVILKLKFKVLEDVEDGEIGVSVLYSAGDIANHDEKMIMPSELDGSIVVYTNVAGDITGDDKINALDLVRLQRYLAGDDVEVNASCDVNGDGVINALDLVRLQRYLAGDDVAIC